MHDLVVRNGTVVDGTGAARRTAEVASDGEHTGELPGRLVRGYQQSTRLV